MRKQKRYMNDESSKIDGRSGCREKAGHDALSKDADGEELADKDPSRREVQRRGDRLLQLE